MQAHLESQSKTTCQLATNEFKITVEFSKLTKMQHDYNNFSKLNKPTIIISAALQCVEQWIATAQSKNMLSRKRNILRNQKLLNDSKVMENGRLARGVHMYCLNKFY